MKYEENLRKKIHLQTNFEYTVINVFTKNNVPYILFRHNHCGRIYEQSFDKFFNKDRRCQYCMQGK